jgi:hypothetical protein
VKRGFGGKKGGETRRACCMISELLEESGLDRRRIRQVRKQVLNGIILLCQWQLERMEQAQAREPAAAKAEPQRGGRRVKID